MKRVDYHGILRLAGSVVLSILLLSCAGNGAGSPAAEVGEEETGPVTQLQVTSSAFSQGEAIPLEYTCDGEDVSPPLAWSGAPDGVASYSLIMDDPDAPAGTWVHWVLFDISPQTTQLAEDLPATIGVQGNSSWDRTGYGGPCPPSGEHRYFFKLYALDTTLGLEAGATKEEVLEAMAGHVVAQGELMGTYSR